MHVMFLEKLLILCVTLALCLKHNICTFALKTDIKDATKEQEFNPLFEPFLISQNHVFKMMMMIIKIE